MTVTVRATSPSASIRSVAPAAIRAAMAEAKDLVGFVDANPIDDAMVEETAQRIARVRASSEGVEGVSALLERRAPSWRGKATT